MTPQETAVEQFKYFAQNETSEKITFGLLPASGGIVLQVITDGREFISLNLQNRRAVILLNILAKYKSQSTAYSQLCKIANSCGTAKFSAPVVNADARSGPAFVGKDGDYWIYSMTVDIRIEI